MKITLHDVKDIQIKDESNDAWTWKTITIETETGPVKIVCFPVKVKPTDKSETTPAL